MEKSVEIVGRLMPESDVKRMEQLNRKLGTIAHAIYVMRSLVGQFEQLEGDTADQNFERILVPSVDLFEALNEILGENKVEVTANLDNSHVEKYWPKHQSAPPPSSQHP